ncbi:MAG: thiamine pyrophosphate-dependent enzyme [Pseudomonadota bacterium]|nr:thiamine pyrophosphate-dependent enzyme [Pseudomonadota bacterium]
MSPDESKLDTNSNTGIHNYADAIVAAMAAGGIDHLFFTSGSDIGFYQEATAKARVLGHNNPVRLVTVPLEHISLNAALGFAAMTGRPAATAVHVDVGTLHYGGAIHTAWRSRLPVLMTAGYPPTSTPGTLQGSRAEGGHIWMQETFDQNGIVRNYTKWERRLTYQDNPGVVTSRAIQVARSEPQGPSYLSIPKELTFLPLREEGFPSAVELGIPRVGPPTPEDARQVAKKLIAAEHPVCVISGSGRNPDTVPVLVELAELLGLAVTESANRAYLSFPFDHPLYQAQNTVAEADAVFVLDVEVPWADGRNVPPPADAYIAAAGFDPSNERVPTFEFTANLRFTADPLLTIQAIMATAKELLTDTDRKRIKTRTEKLAEISSTRVANLVEEAEARSKDTPIDPLWLSYQIGLALDDNCVVLDDTLGPSRFNEYLSCSKPLSYVRNPGSSGGWGPGAAFGAKLGAPDKDIVCVIGDGFYQFGTPQPAIWAGAHHDAPFLTIVYTNRSYTTGTLAVQNSFGPESYATQTGYEGGYFDPPIDFAAEAEAAGAYGENVDDPMEVGPAIKRGLEQVRSGRPAVISVWLKRLIDGG